jgi:tetratricopeptide (TPR) repeat protein
MIMRSAIGGKPVNRPTPTRLPRILALAGLVLFLAGPAGADDGGRARAYELYDLGRYDEAAPLLEAIDEAGRGDGPLLYRLYYCRRKAGDPRARQTLQRALERLELETPESQDLETWFYMANTYSALGRPSDRARIAHEATRRVEEGILPAPADGIEMFRLAKLYAEQSRTDEAIEWYEAFLATPTDENAGSTPYMDWARRYIAEQAYRSGDYAAAERHLSASLSEGGTLEDYDRLAVARCRLGRYREAASAWRRGELANPAQANRARYAYRLAELAAELPPLPEAAPDGRPWTAQNRGELEELLKAQAAVVRATMEEARAEQPLKRKKRKKLQAKIDEAQPVFVAAGLEYVMRGFPIRETAFFGGYAPLVFKRDEWVIP